MVWSLVFYPTLRLGETKPALRFLKTGGAPNFHQPTPPLSVEHQDNLGVPSSFTTDLAFTFLRSL